MKNNNGFFSFSSIFFMIILASSLLPFTHGIVPPDFPIMGESSSMDETVMLSENMGFTLKLPVDTPQDLILTDIRLQTESKIFLIFSVEIISKNMTLPELLETGGIMVIENKKDPKDVAVIDSLIAAGEKNGLTTLVNVNENFGYYGEASDDLPWRTTLFWLDDETRIEMLSSPTHFSQEDLIQFAESFTDWSTIKISTTTTKLTIISTITSTTTTTLINTVTETSIEKVVEPSIYIWAVGATVIAIILPLIITLRKRR